METVVFESEIIDETIKIPEQYKGVFSTPVFVTITANTQQRIIPCKNSGKITIADFGKPFIHTNGWKFNRDEANERSVQDRAAPRKFFCRMDEPVYLENYRTLTRDELYERG